MGCISLFQKVFWASKKLTSSKLICYLCWTHTPPLLKNQNQNTFQFCTAWHSQNCTFLESNNLSLCACNPVNPVVCDHLPNELACSGLFIGNQWPSHTPACDCNDQRPYSSERDLTLSNEITEGRCALRRSSRNTLTKVNCQLLLLPWNDHVGQLVLHNRKPQR